MTTIDPAKLKNSFLGEELDAAELEALAGLMEAHVLADGETLVSQDEADPRLFLLAEGRLEVWSEGGDGPHRAYVMKPGEFAGVRAFVDRAPRQATLKAHGEALVYSLSPERFESLLDRQPRLVYRIMRALVRITHVNLMRMNSEAQELANYVFKRGGRY